MEIEKNGACFLNSRRIELLGLIREHGSILSASKALRMSYQQAWSIIRDINSSSPLPVVVRQRGGANGGGAVVTEYGQNLISRYESLLYRFNRCIAEMDDELQSICSF
ncbi:MAG: LysR family transcriptional regulator [Tannerella sp.]|nr:LysR family transcriptional regulator [Tannerella sp.]